MALALSALLCLASGFLLVSLGWRNGAAASSKEGANYVLAASLSVGFGLGMFSVVFFLCLLLGGAHLILIDVGVCAVLLVSFLGFRAHTPLTVPIRERSLDQLGWLPRVLTIAFAIALCAAIYSAIMRMLAYPHGEGWDAFSIWNLHARFLFRGGLNWRDGFTPLLPWSHPDYPLLLPGVAAHFWSYLGHDSPAVPAIIGLLFTFSTVGLLFSALSILRGRTAAMLAATALLATPSFIEQGTSQYADVPLSFFILATLALIGLHDDHTQDDSSKRTPGLLALAGLAAACGAWTKNEGLLFLCAIVAARGFTLLRGETSAENWSARLRQLAPLLVATVPALLLIAYFKRFIAPPGDLFSDPTTTLHKLLDPARYWAIIRWYFKGFFRFGRWLLIPGSLLLIAFYFAAGKEDRPQPRSGIRTSALALALTLAGYFAVYLITPYDIYWHLRFSLTRLFLQLWPSAIFLIFLMVKSGSIADNRAHSERLDNHLNVSK
jgi:hypothetical protein